MPTAKANWLIGRRIVAFESNRFEVKEYPGDDRVGYDPVITLDNGAKLTFVVGETGSDYSVTVMYHPKAS